ncbi:hypothetical protein EJD97_007415, partial [Solanum chilense]
INTRRNAARRLEEEVSNAGAPPHGDQVPLLEEDANVEQAPANPPPVTEVEMRAILAQIAQAITIQAQAATFQAQAMTAQANREVDEDPQEFIDEVYKTLHAMGVSSSEKDELAT